MFRFHKKGKMSSMFKAKGWGLWSYSNATNMKTTLFEQSITILIIPKSLQNIKRYNWNKFNKKWTKLGWHITCIGIVLTGTDRLIVDAT